MGMYQSDLVIKTILELGLQDLRENTWLFNDIFSEMLTNPYLVDKFGPKYVAGAKAWFLNNNVEVYQGMRKDSVKAPYISVTMQGSDEVEAEISLAQQTAYDSVQLDPTAINKPIPAVLGSTVIVSYTIATGLIILPPSVNLNHISVGQFVVDPASGPTMTTYEILAVDDTGVYIAPNTNLLVTTIAIIPKHQYWYARKESTTMRESLAIGCHISTDLNELSYLFNIVAYTFFRYNEALMEGVNMDLAKFSFSGVERDMPFFGENSQESCHRFISVSGLVHHEWIKAPKRVIEGSILEDPDFDQEHFEEVGAGNIDPETGEVVVTKSGIIILEHDTPVPFEEDYVVKSSWKGEFDK